jgi:D-alanyl-D-alanine dipeptidase
MSARVVQAADQVDGVVELLDAHAAALDVAGALRPAVAVLVEALDRVAQVAPREVVQLVAEAVVAGPAPHERHRARDLTISSVLKL